MIIKTAQFVKSATKPEHYPVEPLPEILLVGRSNVGKSSFINSVLHRKNLAHTSGQPGKTQTLNFYLVNETFHFVDVPGYGYARVSKTDREAFGVMIDSYLQTREQLELVIQLIDARHMPTKDDILMYQYLSEYDIPTIVVGTKIDKVPRTKRYRQEREILTALQIDANQFIPFSSTERINHELVYDLIEQVLEGTK